MKKIVIYLKRRTIKIECEKPHILLNELQEKLQHENEILFYDILFKREDFKFAKIK